MNDAPASRSDGVLGRLRVEPPLLLEHTHADAASYAIGLAPAAPRKDR
jgi:hypothetical protein